MNNLKIEYHKNDNVYSATLSKTGIVAYGDSDIKAVNKLKKMLIILIDVSYDLYRKDRSSCGVEQSVKEKSNPPVS